MSKFLKGTMILLAAGLVTRVLGFINRIVIARFIGEEGVGLYMMAFPTMILVVTITQIGLPVAISKNVAEAEARGDTAKIKKILIVSLATTISLSIVFTPALILLAPLLSETLFTDNRTHLPLMAIAPIVPIIAVSSVIRGYFQGRQNMKPAAYSQMIEQIVRISLIALMTKAFLPYGIEYAAAGAMLAAVIGELASLLYLMTTFKLKKKFRVRNQFFKYVSSGKSTFNELMTVALPTTGSRMIGSVAWFFEPIVVAQSLALAGVAAAAATKQYGALTGFAMPLLMLPSFITYSLSTSLVPAISEANSQNNMRLIEYRLQQALRFAFITGGLAVVVLYVLSDQLMEVMYGSSSGSHFIKLMAPFFLFYYYQGPLQATLQALNLARAAMINSLIGAVVKTAVIFLLASQPAFGINGVAMGILTGTVLVTMLHFATVLKAISFTFFVRDYIKTFIAMIVSGGLGFWMLKDILASDMNTALRVILISAVITIVYIILLLILKLIKKNDLVRIPGIGKMISRLAFK
ncbi:stage V sporulation protein B [Cytobacillus firmus]|uniref:Stage V sporulation protein B n=1 Tax=Cytobacillus firmus TaxID=1399 RepID=A0AA46PB42_CYTFI|nr:MULTISPECIES: stage V sporulation protein B [Cytobacillus]KML40543.1 stage V sporulation protein B [Cytobacillus firmus]MBG9590229.1 stage V sporulation protein B [Cytobacillus firmus]MBY6051077.1 stage V sporulation protein B [Cytobacillus firmus]MCC3647540.1 stage V sporulation protein B [Cytobacillus oceanisediminis]MCU1805447.1 stage V sporulation protein B [Cytobacillus firmus]